MSQRATFAPALIALTLLSITSLAPSCGPSEQPNRPGDHAYVMRQLIQHGDLIYATGHFREPENAAGSKLLGHQMLVVLDASDPAKPTFVAEQDLLATAPFAVMGGELIALQHSIDETALGAEGNPPSQPIRVKRYSLSDAKNPTLAGEFELPGTERLIFQPPRRLDDTWFLVSLESSGELPIAESVTWLIAPSAPPGQERVSSIPAACPVNAFSGGRLWCFTGIPQVELPIAAAYDLAADGTLTAAGTTPLPAALNQPRQATALPDGRVALFAASGLYLLSDDGSATLSVDSSRADFESSLVSVYAPPSQPGTLLVRSRPELMRVSATTLATTATLGYPGETYSNYERAGQISPFGAPSSGLAMAAMGDYGVLIFSDDGDALEVVGGYYRRFGTSWLYDDDLTAGNY